MKNYQALKNKMSEVRDLMSILAVLNWDQEVMMPKGGVSRRAGHLSTLAGIYHQKKVNEVEPLLKAVEDHELDQLDAIGKANIHEIRTDIDRTKKLPVEFVRECQRTQAEAQPAWVEAKKNNDFAAFAPHLEKIIAQRIQEAEYVGYEEDPYDALIDLYEPGMKSRELRPLFKNLTEGLLPILDKIREAPQVEDAFLFQKVSEAAQLEWGETLMGQLGYDYTHGRQDKSAHPFSISFGPEDVRITTVVNETDITQMLYSSIHEAGHAMYEQALLPENYGMPAGEYCSLSIHESQSRLWENNVGRSPEFWEYAFADFAKLFPDQLKGQTPESVFRATNKVTPGLIRIYSDELHYHMHIALRFELEHALINQELKVSDLPEAWNAKIRDYLKLEVPNAAEGVLQDVHWSHGSVGYFPTYSLGSLFAAQFMEQAGKSNPQLNEQIKKGEFQPLRDWLRREIHEVGRIYPSNELCKRITGSPLDVKYFIDYAKTKFGRVYGITF